MKDPDLWIWSEVLDFVRAIADNHIAHTIESMKSHESWPCNGIIEAQWSWKLNESITWRGSSFQLSQQIDDRSLFQRTRRFSYLLAWMTAVVCISSLQTLLSTICLWIAICSIREPVFKQVRNETSYSKIRKHPRTQQPSSLIIRVLADPSPHRHLECQVRTPSNMLWQPHRPCQSSTSRFLPLPHTSTSSEAFGMDKSRIHDEGASRLVSAQVLGMFGERHTLQQK